MCPEGLAAMDELFPFVPELDVCVDISRYICTKLARSAPNVLTYQSSFPLLYGLY